MNFKWIIARRYLASPKRVSLISVITSISMAGVSLGVAALIVVLSVMNGFYDFVRDLLVSLDPHVRIVSAEERGFVEADSLRAVALSLPQVAQATPYVEGKALLLHEGVGSTNKVVIVRGVDPETLGGVSAVMQQTDFGEFDLSRKATGTGIVLGMSLGQRFGLVPGSDLALLTAPGIEQMLTQVFGVPPLTRFEVRGLYQMESVYDESHVFIGIPEAQRLFRMDDHVSGVELRLDDLDAADEVKKQLQARLDPARFEVLTWYDLQKSLYDVMRLEKWGASLILVLIIIVAAFNIVSTLTMVVRDKTREIGILKAMGLRPDAIRRVFLLQGAFIGIVGTGLGLVLGVATGVALERWKLIALDPSVYFIDHLPVQLQIGDVALIVGLSVIVSILATLHPAAVASRLYPIEAIRSE